jgi:hypothetical protein
MKHYLAMLLLILPLMVGSGVTSCLAAAETLQALACCSKDCPRSPEHNPNKCCSVGTATQDGEVAPALQLDSSSISAAIVPLDVMFAASIPTQLAVRIVDWSPPPRLARCVLCSLQI